MPWSFTSLQLLCPGKYGSEGVDGKLAAATEPDIMGAESVEVMRRAPTQSWEGSMVGGVEGEGEIVGGQR